MICWAQVLFGVRIGLVCPYDWSVPGGVQAQVAWLARAFSDMSSDVTVIAPNGPWRARHPSGRTRRTATTGDVSTSACRHGGGLPFHFVSVGRSLAVPANGSVAPVAPTPAAMLRTVRALWRLRADVVHVHEPLTPGPSLAAMLAGPRPMVVTFHRAGTDRIYLAESRLLGGVIRRADCAVAVSEAAADTARAALGRHLGGDGLLVVPNGVDLGYYACSGSPVERSPAGGEPAQLTLLFLGRHEDRKGLQVLLEAFGELRGEVRLEVVGDGPRSADLRRRYDDSRIAWLGAVSDDEKARRLATADLFVAPSIEGESFGVVLLEAMAAGAPVVASDLPGYRLAAGDGARFVPPGNVRMLTHVLQLLLEDPVERGRLAAAGRKVAATHSMEATAQSYMEIYRRLRATRVKSEP